MLTPFMLATSPADITPSAQPMQAYDWATQNAVTAEDLEEAGKASWTSFATTTGIPGQGLGHDDARGD